MVKRYRIEEQELIKNLLNNHVNENGEFKREVPKEILPDSSYCGKKIPYGKCSTYRHHQLLSVPVSMSALAANFWMKLRSENFFSMKSAKLKQEAKDQGLVPADYAARANKVAANGPAYTTEHINVDEEFEKMETKLRLEKAKVRIEKAKVRIPFSLSQTSLYRSRALFTVRRCVYRCHSPKLHCTVHEHSSLYRSDSPVLTPSLRQLLYRMVN